MSRHEQWCQQKQTEHTDASKRIADTYNLHRVAIGLDAVGQWFACALEDGRSDNELYPSKLSCVQHQHHNESRYTFIKIVPTGMNVCEAEVMLTTARRLYDKGMRMADPDHKHGGMDLIKRLTVEDQLNQARLAVTNLRMPWEG